MTFNWLSARDVALFAVFALAADVALDAASEAAVAAAADGAVWAEAPCAPVSSASASGIKIARILR
ncbi:hypothetical protein [Paraburkholderia sp. Ac-20347]|uniref:hypothetical protein n=1 Tax=Paraburkholderia sp. Ac-20347 TaxID=2703892 RepID=UPI001F125CC6|nr:hypothetical protein [Paraburkholderia sp. Ac-20347]